MSEATPLLELVILHITRFRVEIHRKKASINLKCFATQTFEFISFALFMRRTISNLFLFVRVRNSFCICCSVVSRTSSSHVGRMLYDVELH